MVYCFPAGWLWGEHGFLKRLGAVDIAGSGGVHLVGGASGRKFFKSKLPESLGEIQVFLNKEGVVVVGMACQSPKSPT